MEAVSPITMRLASKRPKNLKIEESARMTLRLASIRPRNLKMEESIRMTLHLTVSIKHI